MHALERRSLLDLSADRLPARYPIAPGSWLQLDRSLPFLLVFHQPADGPDLSELVRGEAAYLVLPHRQTLAEQARHLIRSLIEQRAGDYGAFLIVDIRVGEPADHALSMGYDQEAVAPLARQLETALTNLPTLQQAPPVRHYSSIADPVVDRKWLERTGSLCLHLTLPSVYFHSAQKRKVPVLFRKFRRTFSEALRQMVYDFIRVQTTFAVRSPGMLGRSSVDEAFRRADRQLAAIEQEFDFLLLVSAINSESAWEEFQRGGYRQAPTFYYRILPVDPEQLKKRLYSVEIDEVHDPALSFLLRDKRNELGKQLDMLQERGTDDFFYSSIRLYQPVDAALLKLARTILAEVKVKDQEEATVSAADFAERARAEFDYFRALDSSFSSDIFIQDDVPGVMVSRGRLFLTPNTWVRPSRVEALLQHEIGTHVLTFHNGNRQPMTLMRYGLADYDELQEGLAVLAEYLVGGLDAERLRLLAERVITGANRLAGVPFAQAYGVLVEEHHCAPAVAFETVTRIYQSGGFIKDIIYLRGFVRLLEYLQQGHALTPLLSGKIAVKHIPVIQELIEREILRPPALLPRYLQGVEAQQKLEALKQGYDVLALVKR
jgi:uncharacterized protein (TIGR02421 family)